MIPPIIYIAIYVRKETKMVLPGENISVRHCEDPSVPAVEYPLAIKVDNRACNDTVEYHCKTR